MPKATESIKVVFRVRPLSTKEKADGRKIITIAHEKQGVIELRNTSALGGDEDVSKTFTFDHVFSENSTQRNIYDVCAAPVVQSVLEGYNGTIFAYGQTGAGKSHTMEGANEPSALRGIIPNSFEHIFDHIALNNGSDKYLVRASYFEIYNEEIRDLLSKNPLQSLELKEADSGVYVKNLKSVVVKSVAEIDSVLQKGKGNRSVGATLMNAGSSRSHSVFSIVIECCSTDGNKDEHIRVGKLNLVDLAGSERQGKTGATGERLKEATKINLSLSALGNVISALVDGRSHHVPYRDSKLTRILQDSLGGNTKTVMCANAGPADYNYDESLSTLRYANRAKKIKNRPIINEDPKDAMLREYQEEIARLKEHLAEMPSPPGGNALSGAASEDKEAILEEYRAMTEAKMESLKLSNQHTAEEHAELQKTLESEKKARMDTERQRLEMQTKLDEMEKELMIGGEIADAAAKQEAALRKAEKDLVAKQESELALTRRINEAEEEKGLLEEKHNSLEEEVAHKTRSLKKLYRKYRAAKAEIQDLEEEAQADHAEVLDSVRELQKQLKLKDFIITNFIPPEYALLYDDVENGGRAIWDESKETWMIPPLNLQGGMVSERAMTSRSTHRPETDFSRQRKAIDPNPRYRTSDIVDLELVMPTKSTPDADDPNTARKIASILAMNINDPVEETSSSRRNHHVKHREKQYLSVNDGSSKSRRKKSRRPTTAM